MARTIHKTISDSAKTMVGKKVLSYIDKDPETNIPKLLNWIQSVDVKGHLSKGIENFREAFDDKDGNWYKLIMSFWTDIDDGERENLVTNFVMNSMMIGTPRQREVSWSHDCNVPWAILMDPTSACNLHCIGCWAAEYGNKLNLSLEELEDIIDQAMDMGTYMFIFSGGEPLVRKDDIITLCEEYPDCEFLAFTNGTLIDEAFADEMLRVKNFIPAISIEGNEETTDARRGKGTYAKVQRAMKILREKKLLFGASICWTSANTEVIASEEFTDSLIENGVKFAWYFAFMPAGKDAPVELIPTAQQRKLMYEKIREYRQTKPLLTVDFWNDGELAGGCIAGGRAYLHINANGDIEPCAFIHYADSNIHDKTLLEAYESPLFMAYRKRQPFNDNMLLPCPVMDNRDVLAEMVRESGAHSTDVIEPESAEVYCAKCYKAQDAWTPVAKELWGDKVYTGHLRPKSPEDLKR